MAFELANGVFVVGNDPIDYDRYIAADIAKRDSIVTLGRSHEGLQCYVKSNKTLYILKGETNANWEEAGSGGDISGFVDLTTDQTIDGTKTFVQPIKLGTDPYAPTISGDESGLYSRLFFDAGVAKHMSALFRPGTGSDTVQFQVNNSNDDTNRGRLLVMLEGGEAALATDMLGAGIPVTTLKLGESTASTTGALQDIGFWFDKVEKAKINSDGSINAYRFKTDGGSGSQFVKGDGTLDNSTYLTSISLLNVAYKNLNNNFTTNQTITGVIQSSKVLAGGYIFGQEASGALLQVKGIMRTGDIYLHRDAAGTQTSSAVKLAYDGAKLSIGSTTVFTGNVTATNIIRNGGTSSQFLKADGSVDSNTYLTSASLTNVAYKNINNNFTTGQTVNGAISITDTGADKIVMTRGTGSAKIGMSNNVNGMFFDAGNNGADMYLTETGLGIGTTSPGEKLHVFGNNPIIRLQQDGGIAGNSQLYISAAGGSGNTSSVRLSSAYISTDNATPTSLGFGSFIGDSLLYVDGGNRKVGVGSHTPAERLHVQGANAKIKIGTNGPDGDLGIVFNHYVSNQHRNKNAIISSSRSSWGRADMHFVVNTAGNDSGYTLGTDTKLFIDGFTGNVGIGTTSPSEKLEVAGNGLFSGTVTALTSIVKNQYGGVTSLFTSDTEGNATTIMRGGNYTHGLFLEDCYKGNGSDYTRYCSIQGGYTNDAIITLKKYNTDGTASDISTYSATGANIGGNGIFGGSVTATSFFESSLRKIKKNILPFEKSGLDIINSLDIVTYDKKDDSAKDKIGVIIDDSPKEIASEEHDAVDLYKTIFVQAKAIQELTERLEKLEKLLTNG